MGCVEGAWAWGGGLWVGVAGGEGEVEGEAAKTVGGIDTLVEGSASTLRPGSSQCIINTIQRLLCLDPKRRITAGQALSH